MKLHSWSKPHTFQSALHMLSVDHRNTDGPPFPVKYVRKFRSTLGGEVAYRCVCVCVCVCVYLMYEEQTLCMFLPCEEQTSDEEWKHRMSAVGFGFIFGLVILEYSRINLKIMVLPCVRSSHSNSDSYTKKCITEYILHSAYTAWNIRVKCGLLFVCSSQPKSRTSTAMLPQILQIQYQSIFIVIAYRTHRRGGTKCVTHWRQTEHILPPSIENKIILLKY